MKKYIKPTAELVELRLEESIANPNSGKGNNGWGNGDQDAPGGSGDSNGAENDQGNKGGDGGKGNK